MKAPEQEETYEPRANLSGDAPVSAYSKAAGFIAEKSYRPSILKAWPAGVSYGAENSYPDAAPYNYTHRPRYVASALRGGSSASYAATEGGY